MAKRIAAAMLAAMVCGTGSAGALGPVDASVDVSAMSQYVWRGVALNDELVLQPSVSVEFNGFTANVWGNMDLTDSRGDKGDLNEVDYTLDYTFELPLVSFTAGVSRYDYSVAGWEPTTEAYLGVESGVPGNPSLTVYRDIDAINGTYVELGASQTLPMGLFTGLEVSSTLGWGSRDHNRGNYEIGGMDAGFTDFSVTAGLPVGIGDIVSVKPVVSFTYPLSSDIRDTYDSFIAVFGISASAAF